MVVYDGDDAAVATPNPVIGGEEYDDAELSRRNPFTRAIYGPRRSISLRRLMQKQGFDSYSQDITPQEASLFRNASVAYVKFPADGSEVIRLTDPYDAVDKFRFEDSYRADPIVRRCIHLLAKFALGKRTKTVLDTTEEFAPGAVAAGKKDTAISTVLSEQETNQLQTFIDNIHKKVNFHARVQAAFIQAKVAGRSAILVQADKNGMPTELKVLNWKKLGSVYVDKDSWKFLGVDYDDRPRDEPLLAKEIIYFTNHDYHITPDSLFYGISDIEPVAHVSETNRILDEIDLKEGARSLWAPKGLIKFQEDATEEEQETFAKGFYPGTMNTTSQRVEVQTFDIKMDFAALTGARDSNDRRIARAMGVPSFLVGFEAVTNRATSSQILLAWQDSDLANDRTTLQDIIEPQWLDKLILLQFPDLVGKIKAKLEFENITFEGLKDIAEAAVPLVKEGIIPNDKALELLGFDDVREERRAQREKEETERKEAFQAQMDLQRERMRHEAAMHAKSLEHKDKQLTAQQKLDKVETLKKEQEDKSVMNEFIALQKKLMLERHKKQMDLMIKRASMYEQIDKKLKNIFDG